MEHSVTTGRTGAEKRRTGRQAVRVLAVLVCSGLCCLVLSGCSMSGSSISQTAATAMSSGDYATAAPILQQQADAEPDSEAVWRALGIARMGLGEYAEAAAAFEQALHAAGPLPGSMEYDINAYLGSCYYKLGEYDKALSVYDAICALRPKDADALVLRGAVKAAMDDTDGMDRDFRQAIALDPDNVDRLVQIYQTAEDHGCEEIGRGYLTDLLAQSGSSLDDYDRGRLSYYAGDYQTAKTCLERIRDQNNYNVSILLGRTYEALGDYNYASSVYQAYLDHDTTHPEVYNQLGLCLLEMGDAKSALSAFESGLAQNDSSAAQSLAFNQIVAYERLENFSKAYSLIQTYLQNYPGDEAAQREEVFLSTRSGSTAAEGTTDAEDAAAAETAEESAETASS